MPHSVTAGLLARDLGSFVLPVRQRQVDAPPQLLDPLIGLRDNLLEPLLLIGIIDRQRFEPLETRRNLAARFLECAAEFWPLRQQEAALRAFGAPHL